MSQVTPKDTLDEKKTPQAKCSLRTILVIENGCFIPSVCGQFWCMGVSKNTGTPKWMVKIMEIPIKIDDLGVPLFLETPIYL